MVFSAPATYLGHASFGLFGSVQDTLFLEAIQTAYPDKMIITAEEADRAFLRHVPALSLGVKRFEAFRQDEALGRLRGSGPLPPATENRVMMELGGGFVTNPATPKPRIQLSGTDAPVSLPPGISSFLAEAPAALRIWVEEIEKGQAYRKSHGFDKADVELIFRAALSECFKKILEDRGFLTRKEEAFFRTLAIRFLETGYFFPLAKVKQELEPLPPEVVFIQFGFLHDFFIFNRINFENAGYSLAKFAFAREDFSRAVESSLHCYGDDFKHPCDTSIDEVLLEAENQLKIAEMAKVYASQHGFAKINEFPIVRAFHDLSALSDSYDLVVPIAKGGLFSGAVADSLGLPTRVMEVHAHHRKRPTWRWIDPVRPEEFKGKRILLVDKDTVTGASVKLAVQQLRSLQPASIGVYLNNAESPGIGSSKRGIALIEDLGVSVHHPGNLSERPLLPTFFLIHEKLRTPLGRLRKSVRDLNEIADRFPPDQRIEADIIREFVREQEELYFALNQFLPGMEQMRGAIVNRLEGMIRFYLEAIRFQLEAAGIGGNAEFSLAFQALTYPVYPAGSWNDLARARYHETGLKFAAARKIQNIHMPISHLHSFSVAKQAEEAVYDVALIVGPEGFAYEPFFHDFDIPTVAVNIPEDDYGGERTLTLLDDLSCLKGKRVLVVEDDIQSGATLRKLLEAIRVQKPEALGLYLGQPSYIQKLENVPEGFEQIYVSPKDTAQEEKAFQDYLDGRKILFKKPFTPSSFRQSRFATWGQEGIFLLRLEDPRASLPELQREAKEIFRRRNSLNLHPEAMRILIARCKDAEELQSILRDLNDAQLDRTMSAVIDLAMQAEEEGDKAAEKRWLRWSGKLEKYYDAKFPKTPQR